MSTKWSLRRFLLALLLFFAVVVFSAQREPEVITVETRVSKTTVYRIRNPGGQKILLVGGCGATGRFWFPVMRVLGAMGYDVASFNFSRIGYGTEESVAKKDALKMGENEGPFITLPEYIAELRAISDLFAKFGTAFRPDPSAIDEPILLIGHSNAGVVINKYLGGAVESEKADDYSYQPQEQQRIAREVVMGAVIHGTTPYLSREFEALVDHISGHYRAAEKILGSEPHVPFDVLQFFTSPASGNPLVPVNNFVIRHILDLIGTGFLPNVVGGVQVENFQERFHTPEGRRVLQEIIAGGLSDMPIGLGNDFKYLREHPDIEGELNPLVPITRSTGLATERSIMQHLLRGWQK